MHSPAWIRLRHYLLRFCTGLDEAERVCTDTPDGYVIMSDTLATLTSETVREMVKEVDEDESQTDNHE